MSRWNQFQWVHWLSDPDEYKQYLDLKYYIIGLFPNYCDIIYSLFRLNTDYIKFSDLVATTRCQDW